MLYLQKLNPYNSHCPVKELYIVHIAGMLICPKRAVQIGIYFRLCDWEINEISSTYCYFY